MYRATDLTNAGFRCLTLPFSGSLSCAQVIAVYDRVNTSQSLLTYMAIATYQHKLELGWSSFHPTDTLLSSIQKVWTHCHKYTQPQSRWLLDLAALHFHSLDHSAVHRCWLCRIQQSIWVMSSGCQFTWIHTNTSWSLTRVSAIWLTHSFPLTHKSKSSVADVHGHRSNNGWPSLPYSSIFWITQSPTGDGCVGLDKYQIIIIYNVFRDTQTYIRKLELGQNKFHRADTIFLVFH